MGGMSSHLYDLKIGDSLYIFRDGILRCVRITNLDNFNIYAVDKDDTKYVLDWDNLSSVGLDSVYLDLDTAVEMFRCSLSDSLQYSNEYGELELVSLDKVKTLLHSVGVHIDDRVFDSLLKYNLQYDEENFLVSGVREVYNIDRYGNVGISNISSIGIDIPHIAKYDCSDAIRIGTRDSKGVYYDNKWDSVFPDEGSAGKMSKFIKSCIELGYNPHSDF